MVVFIIQILPETFLSWWSLEFLLMLLLLAYLQIYWDIQFFSST